MRKPRHLSVKWHASQDIYFGCRRCGYRLSAIEGPAADRASEVAADRVPDPEGTLRWLLVRDADLMLRFSQPETGPHSIRLGEVMSRGLAGVELRTQPASARPEAANRVAPLLLTFYGLPWVICEVRPVEEIVSPPQAFADQEVRELLEFDSVEAGFAVAIDPEGRWCMSRLQG